ncbi:flagellar hook-length control protein FliK [Thermodesulfitimonas autotrophica]|uniref:Flagellar hook-length control protein FliK n=1 Tax=Thermodesulfitimonas autotrophica TaxID=1894989 RepID=A0A3N5BFV0_9THEO|nr:flagellar hook-length control protein FliK [Thermodesulfitimonas autotrophica]RPF42921.1 flagellar hook-length control protein FliK [Thermodesulfitimonas autotrophica]
MQGLASVVATLVCGGQTDRAEKPVPGAADGDFAGLLAGLLGANEQLAGVLPAGSSTPEGNTASGAGLAERFRVKLGNAHAAGLDSEAAVLRNLEQVWLSLVSGVVPAPPEASALVDSVPMPGTGGEEAQPVAGGEGPSWNLPYLLFSQGVPQLPGASTPVEGVPVFPQDGRPVALESAGVGMELLPDHRGCCGPAQLGGDSAGPEPVPQTVLAATSRSLNTTGAAEELSVAKGVNVAAETGAAAGLPEPPAVLSRVPDEIARLAAVVQGQAAGETARPAGENLSVVAPVFPEKAVAQPELSPGEGPPVTGSLSGPVASNSRADLWLRPVYPRLKAGGTSRLAFTVSPATQPPHGTLPSPIPPGSGPVADTGQVCEPVAPKVQGGNPEGLKVQEQLPGATGVKRPELPGLNAPDAGADSCGAQALLGTEREHLSAGERLPLAALPGQLVREIARQVTLLRDHGGTVRLDLQLDPPHLGQLAVKLSFADEKLKVHFVAADVAVKEVLVASLDGLRAELGRIGINLGEAYVSLSQESSGGESQGAPRSSGGVAFAAGNLTPKAEPPVVPEGVNYLI